MKKSKSHSTLDLNIQKNSPYLFSLTSPFISSYSKFKYSMKCETTRTQSNYQCKAQQNQFNKVQSVKSLKSEEFNQKKVKLNLKTFIRLKPFDHQKNLQFKTIISKNKMIIMDNKQIKIEDNKFNYDFILRQDSSQYQTYKNTCENLVCHFTKGFNATVFTYGQTGSGKTYTMFGNLQNSNKNGIISFSVQDIFRITSGFNNKNIVCSISCSMVQIYKQNLIDLFSLQKKQLKIRESRPIFNIQGLTLIKVVSQAQVLQLISSGNNIKKIRQTNLNDASSRSHTIFTLYLEVQQNDYKRISKFNFVDLAGCQKISKSNVNGQGLQQAKKINFSLACLGNTINALIKGNQHIPYRDSKLTRILQDSLSGNSLTSLIVTCSLENQNFSQTLSSLKFASRAKMLKMYSFSNNFKKKEKNNNSKMAHQNLKKEYQECKTKLKKIQQLAKLYKQENRNQFNQKNFLKTQTQTHFQKLGDFFFKLEKIFHQKQINNQILKTNYSFELNPFQIVSEKNTDSPSMLQSQKFETLDGLKYKKISNQNERNHNFFCSQIEKYCQKIKAQEEQIKQLQIQIQKLKFHDHKAQKILKNSFSVQINIKLPQFEKQQLTILREKDKYKRQNKFITLKLNQKVSNQSSKFKSTKKKQNVQNQSLQSSNQQQLYYLIKLAKQINENYFSYVAFQKQILSNQIDLLLRKLEETKIQNFKGDQIFKNKKDLQNQNLQIGRQNFIFQSKYIAFLQKLLTKTHLMNQIQNIDYKDFSRKENQKNVVNLKRKLK